MTARAVRAMWLENAADSRQTYNRLALVLSLLGALLVLGSTSKGGLNITPDAINYIAAARAFANGDGLVRYHENIAFVHWGPLYPIFLAVIEWISRVMPFDLLEAVRFVNAVQYAVIIFLSSRLFLRYLRLHVLALIAVIWVACSFTLFNRITFPLSESLFYVLTLLVVVYWPHIFAPDAGIRQYVILGVLVSLTPVLRFAGYSIIPLVMLSMLLMHRMSLRKRLWLAASFALTALPMMLWILYGQTTPSYRRLRGDPIASILDSLQRTPHLISNWFMPYDAYIPLTGIIFVAIILGVIVWLHRRYYIIHQATGQYPSLQSYPLLVAQYVLVFFVGLVFAFLSSGSPIDARHLSVLYIFVMVLIFYAVEQLICLRIRWLTAVMLMVVAFGTVYKFERIHHISSIDCCSGNSQRAIDLVQWLNHNSLGSGRYYSNTPLPLIHTHLSVSAAPVNLEDWPALLEHGEDVYLIWFDADDPQEFYEQRLPSYYYPLAFDPQQLAEFAEVSVIADLEHGQVLRLEPHT